MALQVQRRQRWSRRRHPAWCGSGGGSALEARFDFFFAKLVFFFETTLFFSFGEKLVTSTPTKKTSLEDFARVTLLFFDFFRREKPFEHGLIVLGR
jgi:hypothetical protein